LFVGRGFGNTFYSAENGFSGPAAFLSKTAIDFVDFSAINITGHDEMAPPSFTNRETKGC